MSNTLQEILAKAYFKMGEKTTSSVFEYTGNMLDEANVLQRSICQWRLEDIITWKTIEAGNLVFMQAKKFYEIVPSVTLWEECEAWATTLTLDTTNLDSSWKIIIEGDIISYTAKTSTTLTSVSGVSVRHLSWVKVRQLYALPDDFYKTIDLYHNENPVTYHEWNDEQTYGWIYYEIVEDSQSGYNYMNTAYLNVVGIEWVSDNVMLKYYRDTTDMEEDGDYCDLPGDSWVKVISNILAGTMLYDTEEAEKGLRFLTAWYAALKKLYKDYAERRRPFRKKVRTSPFTYLE